MALKHYRAICPHSDCPGDGTPDEITRPITERLKVKELAGIKNSEERITCRFCHRIFKITSPLPPIEKAIVGQLMPFDICQLGTSIVTA